MNAFAPDLSARWMPAFFAVAACSWMPHWACHYYRLETGTTFVVGSWQFSPTASVVAMILYSFLILANIAAVVQTNIRSAVAVTSGALHVAFAVLHASRLIQPFDFEVFGYTWSAAASLREVLIVGAFGVFSIVVGGMLRISHPLQPTVTGAPLAEKQ